MFNSIITFYYLQGKAFVCNNIKKDIILNIDMTIANPTKICYAKIV